MASQALLIFTVTTVHQDNSQDLSERQHSKVLVLLSCVVDSGAALKCAHLLAAHKGLDVTHHASCVNSSCTVSKECIPCINSCRLVSAQLSPALCLLGKHL